MKVSLFFSGFQVKFNRFGKLKTPKFMLESEGGFHLITETDKSLDSEKDLCTWSVAI